MILLNYIILLVVVWYFLKTKNYIKTSILLFVLLLLNGILILKIPIQIIYDGIALNYIIKLSFYTIFIIVYVETLLKISRNEIGRDISELLIDIFPDERIKLFGLFFLTQLSITNEFIITFITFIGIGSLLNIKKELYYIIVFISTLLASFLNTVEISYYLNELKFSELIHIHFINNILIIMLFVLAFIFIFTLLFFQVDRNDKMINIVKESLLDVVIITFSFSFIVLLLSSVLDNYVITITSYIKVIIT